MGGPTTVRPDRDLAVDFYRAAGVVLIVLGHWLAAALTYHDGSFGRQNPLVDMRWTQWLTWPFQAVPVFFLVAGYAGAVSWQHWRDSDRATRQTWMRHRLSRPLGPTAVYVGLVSAVVIVLSIIGVPGPVLEYAGWAVALHLWFLAVYVVVVSLTPVAVAAHRRWGLAVPLVLMLGVVAVDTAYYVADVPYVGMLNYLLCFLTLYQLGIAWRNGLLGGRRPVALALGAAVTLGLLIWPGPYPVSMIGVPGEPMQNTEPPSLALLVFGLTQAGVAIALAPAVNRMVHGHRVRRVLAVANDNVLTLYLWHMVPVVIVAIVGYPAGLLPQPPEGSAAWWWARLLWVTVLIVVTAVEMVLLWWARAVFAAPLPNVRVPADRRVTAPLLLVGVGSAAYGLGFLAARGFAPDGRFAWVTILAFALGVLLVAISPAVRTPKH